MPTIVDMDRETLAAVFASRVALCKKTEAEVVAEALKEWKGALNWLGRKGMKEGSFEWMCDEFDLDSGAVRRAIAERRK